jgi:Na+/H+ antiporter NhaD/arsenite permease-like protein
VEQDSASLLVDESASLLVGHQLGYWTLVPFALMLLAIAILPLAAAHWFDRNRNKAIIAVVLGVPTVVYLLAAFGGTGWELTWKTIEEYISFIVLLFALYTIAGGIHLTGNAIATPRHNLTFLATGAVLANFIGTMGASMVLIRPVLRANSERTHKRHTVIFFIFAVSNIGGLLTPLGDPPLFLGFLRGVPFGWTLRLWPQWLLSVGLVLLVYMAFELYYHRKEPEAALSEDVADFIPMRIRGWINVIPLVLVIVAVLFSKPLGEAGKAIHFPFIREVILVVLALISHRLGPRGPRTCNNFSWPPIVEVAVLFAGIFATMIPALALLEARGASLGLTQPWQYFWATGGLSSFLDNAPTYLTFTSVTQGQLGLHESVGALAAAGVVPRLGFSPAQYLAAISCGAVFMGANTYIGNAPNFAVKCIAERTGVKMPSFLGYMGYSMAILVPIWLIVTVIFFL